MEEICSICNQPGEVIVSLDLDGKLLDDMTLCHTCLDELTEEDWISVAEQTDL